MKFFILTALFITSIFSFNKSINAETPTKSGSFNIDIFRALTSNDESTNFQSALSAYTEDQGAYVSLIEFFDTLYHGGKSIRLVRTTLSNNCVLITAVRSLRDEVFDDGSYNYDFKATKTIAKSNCVSSTNSNKNNSSTKDSLQPGYQAEIISGSFYQTEWDNVIPEQTLQSIEFLLEPTNNLEGSSIISTKFNLTMDCWETIKVQVDKNFEYMKDETVKLLRNLEGPSCPVIWE